MSISAKDISCVNCHRGVEVVKRNVFFCSSCGIHFKRNQNGTCFVVGSELQKVKRGFSIGHYQVCVDHHFITAQAALLVDGKKVSGSSIQKPTVEHAIAAALWNAFSQEFPGDIPPLIDVAYYRWQTGGGDIYITMGYESVATLRTFGSQKTDSIAAVVEAVLKLFADLQKTAFEGGAECIASAAS